MSKISKEMINELYQLILKLETYLDEHEYIQAEYINNANFCELKPHEKKLIDEILKAQQANNYQLACRLREELPQFAPRKSLDIEKTLEKINVVDRNQIIEFAKNNDIYEEIYETI